jgi:transcriptional regulator with XRE-family HTH domain
MKTKGMFGDLIDSHLGLHEEMDVVAVAADLTILLHHSGLARADLARRLKVTPAYVSQVLSGDVNMSVKTLAKFTRALGFQFDVVFREANARQPLQPWVIDKKLSKANLHESLFSVVLTNFEPSAINLVAPRAHLPEMIDVEKAAPKSYRIAMQRLDTGFDVIDEGDLCAA